jgi:hypothetical protein
MEDMTLASSRIRRFDHSSERSKIIQFPAAKFCFPPHEAANASRYDSDVKYVANTENERVGEDNEWKVSECPDTENQEQFHPIPFRGAPTPDPDRAFILLPIELEAIDITAPDDGRRV